MVTPENHDPQPWAAKRHKAIASHLSMYRHSLADYDPARPRKPEFLAQLYWIFERDRTK